MSHPLGFWTIYFNRFTHEADFVVTSPNFYITNKDCKILFITLLLFMFKEFLHHLVGISNRITYNLYVFLKGFCHEKIFFNMS